MKVSYVWLSGLEGRTLKEEMFLRVNTVIDKVVRHSLAFLTVQEWSVVDVGRPLLAEISPETDTCV